jgi:hypothetical protein
MTENRPAHVVRQIKYKLLQLMFEGRGDTYCPQKPESAPHGWVGRASAMRNNVAAYN